MSLTKHERKYGKKAETMNRERRKSMTGEERNKRKVNAKRWKNINAPSRAKQGWMKKGKY